MTTNSKTVYRSKIDWWIWCLFLFGFVVIYVAAIGTYWSITLIYGLLLAMICIVSLAGCWYEVDHNQLIVYQFFMPRKYPINKIKEVIKTSGYLYTVGMSKDRVSIKFTDRSVMKSSKPLEISPKDRDRFIAHLKQINPEIVVVS